MDTGPMPGKKERKKHTRGLSTPDETFRPSPDYRFRGRRATKAMLFMEWSNIVVFLKLKKNSDRFR